MRQSVAIVMPSEDLIVVLEGPRSAVPEVSRSDAHVNTTRGSLLPISNLDDLPGGTEGNWVEQLNDHFKFAPCLMGLKIIQLSAAANNET